MDDISNKALAIFVLISMVISLYAIVAPKGIITITGDVSATGKAKVNVSEKLAINFTDDTVNWGTGGVTDSNCTLSTEGYIETSDCLDFTNQSNGLTLENIGNVNAIIELASDKDAQTFINGTSPAFQYLISDTTSGGEANSCDNMAPTTFTDVNTTSPGTKICTKLYKQASKDAIGIELKVTIPGDADFGQREATLTATGTKA